MLTVNGNIQFSNALMPIGMIIELPGTTPLLDFDVNLTESITNPTSIGANFRIDTRNTSTYPLFQWNYRQAYGTVGNLMQLIPTSTGPQLGVGVYPKYTIDLGTTGIIQAKNISPSDSTLKTNIQNLKGATT